MRVAILGRSQLLYRAAEQVLAAGHVIGLVGTSKGEDYYSVGPDDFRRLAKTSDADFFEAASLNKPDIIERLNALRCDIAVSINWQTIIGAEACASFPLGILNAHAGDLPRYRGNACANWAILNGEARVGLCLHQIVPGELDSGPILIRRFMNLDDGVYIGDVYAWMEREIPIMVRDGLTGLADGTARFERQSSDPRHWLRCYPRRPEDGRIDWRTPSVAVHRLIRASSHPFAGAFTTLEGADRVTVWRADIFQHAGAFAAVPGQVMLRADGDPVIACAGGALRLREFEVAGMDGEAGRALLAKSMRARLF